ncbi:MAG TPA: Gfo/Idh/MocA family oxidoreductase [Planctomycetota bacterium]
MSALLLAVLLAQDEKVVRVGLVGLDTSHVIAFTDLLNNPKNANHVPGARVIAAYKGGSADFKASYERVDGFTKQISEKYGIEIVDTIEALAAKVDAVLLESVDGRIHLEQARSIFAARKRVFIDKPLSASLKDAKEIVRLSRESGTPFFSASSQRFSEAVKQLKEDPELGPLLGCAVHSAVSGAPQHPDFSFYGIHGIEAIFALMGPGWESLRRADVDVVAARWKDGRVATYRGLRKGASSFGATAYGEKAVKSTAPGKGSGYAPLVREIVKFFQTGVSPVSPEEMLEVIAFIEAADLSKANGGQDVKLAELLAK